MSAIRVHVPRGAVLWRGLFSAVIAFINAVCTQTVVRHACFGWDLYERRSWWYMFLFSFLITFFVFTLTEFLTDRLKECPDRMPKLLGCTPLIMPVILFVCWLPYLYTYAPGLMNYDTVNQILDFFDGVAPVPFGFVGGQEEVTVFLNAHHPVFTTIIFSAFIKLGVALGNPGRGLTIYLVVQMILGALCISYGIESVWRRTGKKNVLYKWLAVCFFALVPFVPYYMCTMLKNTLHAILMIPFICLYLKMTLRGETLVRSEQIAFVLLCILLGLTQNTGVYLVVISCIPLLFRKLNRKTALVGMISTALLMMILLPKVIYPAANIFPGGKQEILGTCFQQTARFVRDYRDEVTEEDIAVISTVVDFDTVANNYTFDTTDTVKATYKLHATRAEVFAYLKLWIRQGIRHPGAYFRAILPISGQYFAAGYHIGIFDHLPSNEGIFAQITHTREEAEYVTATENYKWFRSLPGIDVLFEHALYVLWIPCFCLYLVITRFGKKRPAFVVPFIVNMLFVLLSPMVYSRYALPLIFTSPFLLLEVLYSKDAD